MDIQKILQPHPELWAFFEKLSPSHKQAYIQWLNSAKKESTQTKRQKDFIELLKNKINN
jgi:uncharacterized protein YdeI (YjbR/CyaY-like superfamily)